MSEAFKDEQFELFSPPDIERHYWQLTRVRCIVDILTRYRLIGRKILDVGCGRGAVVRSLLDHGIDISGVELAPISVPADLSTRVTSGISANDLPISYRTTVNALLILDVIEHLTDPVRFLTELKAAFPNSTHLIITVPARMELWSNYDEYYGHFRRYGLLDLSKVIEHSGLELLQAGYIFKLLYLPLRVLSILQIQRGLAVQAPSRAMRWVHKIITSYFYMEYRIFPSWVPGSSVLALVSLSRRK